ARIGEHALDLLFQHLRIAQSSLTRRRDQFVIRDAAPEEERETRRELEVADAVGTAHGNVSWFHFCADEEPGTCEQTSQCQLDAVLERAITTAFLEEGHQGLDVLRSC